MKPMYINYKLTKFSFNAERDEFSFLPGFDLSWNSFSEKLLVAVKTW